MGKENKFEFKVGDIILYSGTGFIAKAIQLFQGRQWNHAGLVVKHKGGLRVLEADRPGVVLNTLQESIGKRKIMIMRPTFIDVPSNKEFSKLAIEMTESKPYDFAALLWHQLIYKLTGRRRWVGRKHLAGEKLYCSELCAYVYNQIYGLFPQWYKTSPAMLRENEESFVAIKF